METIAKVRRDHRVHKKSIRQIAKDRNLSRNTVRRALRSDRSSFEYERSEQPRPKIGGYRRQLEAMLEANVERPRRQRRTLGQVYEALQDEGFDGSYGAVCHYARGWAKEHRVSASKAFIPLTFGPGEAYQFDWSTEHLHIGGSTCKVQAAHMRLCHSRQSFVRVYHRASMEMVFDAHNRAFALFGGSCERGIYDNMSTAVNKVLPGRKREYNARFIQLCSHYLVSPQACSVAAGWEKGRVEKQVQDVRREMFSAGVRYASLDELNSYLQDACEASGRKRAHPEFPDRSVHEVFEEERSSLIPYVEDFDGWRSSMAMVSKCLLVSFERNRYSVEVSAAGRQVEVYAYADRVVFRLNGKVVGDHRREFGRDQTVYEPLHYLPVLQVKPGALQNGAPFRNWQLPPAMQRIRQRLSESDDGNRQMVSILSAAQELGWEVLEGACAEALAAGLCHADVVINLARRQVQGPPQTAIETPPHLQLREPPRADCSRYDHWQEVDDGS